MKKVSRILAMFIGTVLLFSVIATASMLIPASDNAKENSKAPEKSSGIIKTEAGEWGLERADFIHYAKPENPGKPAKPPKQETCYKLLRVKWKTLPVDYTINPYNPQGLPEDFIKSAISISAEAWDNEISGELFNDAYGVDYSLQYGTQDFKNVLSFGDYPQEGVIGVTSIWYTRRGKQIVEFDILFDTDFTWGDAELDSSLMDLQNIATHELGHGVGLGDIYKDTCLEVTMYGYSTEGETSKRTLEQPDIAGLQEMYGI